jgi:hypothetical protein
MSDALDLLVPATVCLYADNAHQYLRSRRSK